MRSSSAGWTGAELIGGRDEEHPREVERHLEVVIAERVVLRRVEDLEQRRRRVALIAGAQLVDLVEHQDRVRRSGLLERLDEAAGHRADVGAPMSADFSFVAHAARARSARTCRFMARAIDWPSDVLPTPGGPDEAEDRPLHVALELPHREVLDDALLDLVEVVVVLVEDAARFDGIEAVLGRLRPRHVQHPVDVGADHLVLGRGLRHALEAVHLARHGRSATASGRRASAMRVRTSSSSCPSRLAELLLDGLELLAQVVPAAARRSSPAAPATRSCP